MWQTIGMMAEYEHSLISERTRAGVKDAKKRGVKFGRKPALAPEQLEHAKELRTRKKDPKTPKQIARILKCSPATVYRALAGQCNQAISYPSVVRSDVR
jgi:DNA invertase Pin-like site-specific DNA recombinase